MLQIKELYQLGVKELQTELISARKELIKYKLGVRTAHLKEIHLIRRYKKYIARILTILKELSLKTAA